MTDYERRESTDGDPNKELERQLSDLGPLMRRKARAEGDPPDESFIRDLEQRLVREDQFGPSTPGDVRDVPDPHPLDAEARDDKPG